MNKAWTYVWDLTHLLSNGSKHVLLLESKSQSHLHLVCRKALWYVRLDEHVKKLLASAQVCWQLRRRTYLELFGVNFDLCLGGNVAMKLWWCGLYAWWWLYQIAEALRDSNQETEVQSGNILWSCFEYSWRLWRQVTMIEHLYCSMVVVLRNLGWDCNKRE
jgi:hypothetical protein